MSEAKYNKPYRALGTKLKSLRQDLQETITEASGAVEIDTDVLTQIEQGAYRPSEEVLLLLISHFGVKEDDAIKLWNLAGYDRDGFSGDSMANDIDGEIKPTVMVMPNDARIVYTDMVHVAVNNHGVVMNFMQNNGPNVQPMAIARVGMSKEHAESVLEILQKALRPEPKAPKLLPEANSKNTRRSQNSK